MRKPRGVPSDEWLLARSLAVAMAPPKEAVPGASRATPAYVRSAVDVVTGARKFSPPSSAVFLGAYDEETGCGQRTESTHPSLYAVGAALYEAVDS